MARLRLLIDDVTLFTLKTKSNVNVNLSVLVCATS